MLESPHLRNKCRNALPHDVWTTNLVLMKTNPAEIKRDARAPGGHPLEGARAPGGHPLEGARAPGGHTLESARAPGGHPLEGARAPGGHPLEGARAPGGHPLEGARAPGSAHTYVDVYADVFHRKQLRSLVGIHWPRE